MHNSIAISLLRSQVSINLVHISTAQALISMPPFGQNRIEFRVENDASNRIPVVHNDMSRH